MSPNVARKFDQAPALDVGVVERRDAPGTWSVEAIDYENEGVIYQAIFPGPDSEERAREYARLKYGI